MMKKYLLILCALVLNIGLINFSTTYVSAAESNNLIPNPSVETASSNPTLPQNWQTGYLWGTLTANYSYNSGNAQEGNKYLKTTITKYVSGDAKWYFDPILVKPNTQYTFTDYYRSNITSDLLVQVTNQSNNISYLWLGQNPASASWRYAKYDFITPNDVSNITIVHSIYAVGFLDTDNYSLTEKVVTDEIVPNPSLETGDKNDKTLPEDWKRSNWGTNYPTYFYQTTGHSGKRSLSVTINAYASGDAKWYYDPQTVTPGQMYTFVDYYKSDVITRGVVWIITSTGTNIYLPLKVAEPTGKTTWTKYTDKVIMPANAAKASVFHILDKKGYLYTDDYSLKPSEPAGFNRGVISLTFDDSWEVNYSSVLPLMKSYNFTGTQYITTQFVDAPSGRQLKAFQQAGFQLGSHSITHPDLTTLADDKLDYELNWSKNFIQNYFNTKVTSFATPYGYYNAKVLKNIKKYYSSHRSVDAGYNFRSKEDFDIYNIRTQNLTINTTTEQVADWINTAKKDHAWLVLVYHKVDNSGEEYSNSIAQFQDHLKLIQQSGLPTETIDQAISELSPQVK